MAKALSAPRESVGNTAPRITTMTIPKDKIREVIGSGGKVIREICEVTGAKVDIEDDGTVRIAATSEEAGKKAYDWIYGIVAEAGNRQDLHRQGRARRRFRRVRQFHRPEGRPRAYQRTGRPPRQERRHRQEGDSVKVKVLEMDNRGKIRLSMRVVDQQTGEDLGSARRPEPAEAAG